MSKQSRACCHHPLSWCLRVSWELWPQKVQGPPPRDPSMLQRSEQSVHFLIYSALERPRLLPGRRVASLGQVRKCIAHHPAVDHFHQTLFWLWSDRSLMGTTGRIRKRRLNFISILSFFRVNLQMQHKYNLALRSKSK
ncbi:hypothetical protein AVEN_47108-1 [Araneus ventricosus]|uniref:Uncharacterized protein n=1 Tax=Araneus ventricosus TaxID=182803 RepID=A0A4Y2LCE1_ARAVE|nr:hypothetical protein AVEN_47108-1 [Araneus ventricosus]